MRAAAASIRGCSSNPHRKCPVANEVPASGPFQSPSGNIRCTMATYSAGGHTVRCEVSDHDWVATQPDGCQMNWGDRVGMEEGSAAVFGCITCTDNCTGHSFFVSRQTVNLG